MNFRNVPDKTLKRILSYLTFADVSRLRGLTRNINRAAREILNAAFLDLGPRLATRYTTHLISTKSSKNDFYEDCAFRGRVLKLLGSEHSILLAYCRHYVTNGINCFAAGEILDLFYELQRNDTLPETQDEENNKVAKLVLLIDQYLDWFEKFILLKDNSLWFGACIVDLLDSYLSAKYHLEACYNGSLLKFAGQYTINGYAEAPPEISDPLGSHITHPDLLKILRYLRKHARWHNFINSFQEDHDKDSDLNDEQVKFEKIYTKRTLKGYDKIYKKNSYDIIDNRSNVVSLRAIISLQCHRSLAPVRLTSPHDLENSDIMKYSSTRNSITEESASLGKLVENACGPLRSIASAAKYFNNLRRNDEVYQFSLELKAIHSKKFTGSYNRMEEKFVETTMNINYTIDSIFAAQSQCRLY